MSDFNDFSLFDSDEVVNIFDNYHHEGNFQEMELIGRENYGSINNFRKEKKVFKILNYDFLKKKREDSIKREKIKKPWTIEEDNKLHYILINHPNLSWQEISCHFPDRNHIQCMYRWQKVLKPGLKKGKWSEEEDKVLINWVKKNGPYKWSKLGDFLPGRSSKQIRDRWINNLNPDRAKNFNWTETLDKILLTKYIEYGSSWVKISKFIPNSTENMIKNRFYSLLRSTVPKHNKASSNPLKERELKQDLITEVKQDSITEPNKSIEEFLIFGFENEDKNIINNSIKPKKKRKNYSLAYLINFLPYLLEEKGIDVNLIKTPNNSDNTIDRSVNSEKNNYNFKNIYQPTHPLIFDENKKKILHNLFNTLSERFPNSITEKSDEESKKAKFKLKSTILLNFQLTLLRRIFEKCKLNIIQRFFHYFKYGSQSSV